MFQIDNNSVWSENVERATVPGMTVINTLKATVIEE